VNLATLATHQHRYEDALALAEQAQNLNSALSASDPERANALKVLGQILLASKEGVGVVDQDHPAGTVPVTLLLSPAGAAGKTR
jgi:hypothetical protein